ncbi:DNA/RNA non-specific endonuclease [Cronbergia sp. UHCC 0137]|uniref:DNA/RNA non-specific endonuclease n=1 Tax=Cronbergia sp. UHCC 0137 TaxID=3110239 RepID=UPI002B20A426|nr:DNA/RNA non-specific endonuclease [Cronbergia sp. UHCC 0137]MEA5621183.1 DNA/RNA non-specific endonuclease [Cronbergia sp. UHCC 0137]
MTLTYPQKICRNSSLGALIILLGTFNSLLSAKAATIIESFESGSKTSYAAADVSLGTGTWNLNDALIGTSSSDRKNGSKSVRITNSGTVSMMFNRTGAGTITIKHAKYGSDGNSTWNLRCSTNSGSSWLTVGGTVTTSSTTLSEATFTPNISGTVRCQISKTDGSANRLNIDDITITDYTTSSGGSGSSGNVHLTMGNPSNAGTSTNNLLLNKSQYAVGYNCAAGRPNWVSWQLNNSWLGSTLRQDDFRSDTTLPSGCYRVSGTSYSGSGFDRGHMAPSADRTKTVADNSSTFLMTNMIPQAPDNNQGVWASLESYTRDLVAQGKELYIISGGYGSGGTGSAGFKTSIDSGRISVPARTWKIIVVVTPGTGLSGVNTSTRVIAVDIPNAQGVRNANWKNYRVSVDSLESRTGYDFLSQVSTSIQSVIESRVDTL